MSELNNKTNVSKESVSPQKRRRRKSSKRQKAQKLQKRLIWIGAMVVAIPMLLMLGAYLYNRIQFPSTGPELSNSSQDDDLVKKTFEQILANGNSDELVQQINVLRDDPELELPVRLNNLERSADLADALINLEETPDLVRYAQKTKLSALSNKIKISLENNASELELAELSFFADSLAISKDPELREFADTAKFITYTTRFITAPLNSASRSEYLSNSGKQLQALTPLISNPDIASDIFDHILLANKRSPNGEAVVLMKQFADGFANSPTQSINSLGQEMKINLEELQFRNSVSDSGGDHDTEAMVDSFRNLVSSGVGVDSDSAVRWLQRAKELMAKDELESAKELFDLISGIPNQDGFTEEFQLRFSAMNSQLNRIGTPFLSQGLVDSSGKDFTFQDDPNSTYILLFASNASIQKSQREFMAIKNRFGKSLLSPKIQLCLVLLHAPDAHNEVAVFRKLESKLKFIKTLFMHNDSQRFLNLKDDFGIEQLPFLIVVEGDNVRAVEPHVETLEKILAGN